MKHIIECWCGTQGAEGAKHYPGDDPENGPAHKVHKGYPCDHGVQWATREAANDCDCDS